MLKKKPFGVIDAIALMGIGELVKVLGKQRVGEKIDVWWKSYE